MIIKFAFYQTDLLEAVVDGLEDDVLLFGLQHADLIDVIQGRVSEAGLGGGQQIGRVLDFGALGFGGRGVLGQGRVQVRGDLVEVALGVPHLFDLVPQEPAQGLRAAFVAVLYQAVLQLNHLL